MGGRIPAPPSLKLVNGRSAGRDSGGRVVKEGPKFEPVPPEAPEWLPAEARAEWERVVPDMAKLDLLKRIDAASLASYCLAWDRLVAATRIVAAEGSVVHDDKQGRVQRHPALLTAEAASRELRGWAHEFGLTPSAVARLASSKGSDGDQDANPFAATA